MAQKVFGTYLRLDASYACNNKYLQSLLKSYVCTESQIGAEHLWHSGCSFPRMPRPTLIRSKTLPYHVTLRTNNREPFSLPLEKVWQICRYRLAETHLKHGLKTHAFVLMPNHLHLIASTPESDLGTCMREFGSAFAKHFNAHSGRSGRVFGARYYRTAINSDRYFMVAYKYVYRNPVKAKLCSKVEDYPYSTLQTILGNVGLSTQFRDLSAQSQIACPLPIYEPLVPIGRELSPAEDLQTLNWLNEPFPQEAEAQIKKALKRREFKLPRESEKVFGTYLRLGAHAHSKYST